MKGWMITTDYLMNQGLDVHANESNIDICDEINTVPV